MTAPVTPITKLLVANRGEIARRIIRSAHELGIRTVAVYADGDASALHVREAGEAYALGGRSAADTYLRADKLLDVARRSGADGVHPGYGFLSENAAFARLVVDAGLVWVGPPPEAIAAMGDKLAAKRLVAAVGVPTLESVELAEAVDAAPAAAHLGFPVLVKAAAGGGGKGMRVVERAEDLAATIAASRREATSAFGDGTVFLERWLSRPRHVEVQVLGDRHGALVHLFERECSVQRRHQKVVEEAPSPGIGDGLRERMGEAALAAVRAIGYHSAGTVEFLVDGGEFWFLEVNTRLQVEHPVTEAVTGLDLVREMLRVAEGEPLGYTQADVRARGHAIEARLYAEDPANDFLPATGTLALWDPAGSPAVRWDSGVERGSVVSVEFDPLLAKVIAHAPTRREAALRLALALERSAVAGVVTNRDFLVEVLRHPAFLAGDTTTDFIQRHAPARRRAPTAGELATAALAAALSAQEDGRAAAPVLAGMPSGWRNTVMPPEERRFAAGDTEVVVRYRRRRDGAFDTSVAIGGADPVDGEARLVARRGVQCGLVQDGRHVELEVTRAGTRWVVQGLVGAFELTEQPRFPERHVEGPVGGLEAPMPGRVLAVRAAPGDAVTAGTVLVVLEAMKMEHHVTAPEDGVVAEVRVAAGDQVDNGALLLVLEPGPRP